MKNAPSTSVGTVGLDHAPTICELLARGVWRASGAQSIVVEVTRSVVLWHVFVREPWAPSLYLFPASGLVDRFPIIPGSARRRVDPRHPLAQHPHSCSSSARWQGARLVVQYLDHLRERYRGYSQPDFHVIDHASN